jgi:ABC-type antimicrobial peptide transport system permease subunit
LIISGGRDWIVPTDKARHILSAIPGLRELGIRVALGAERVQVLKAALGRPFKLLAYGSAAGLVLGLLATRLLALIVYQATPRDPVVLLGVVLAMLLMGLAAACIPARRALAIDPVRLLREE